MKCYFQTWLSIYSVSVIKGHVEDMHFGHRIRSDNVENVGFYVFEMTPMQDVQNCVESCKSKRQCKVINYSHRTKLCYHISFNKSASVGEDFNAVDFQEKKPGFSYGDKRDWDMTGYKHCESCNEVGVCSEKKDPKLPKCQNSGCKRPEEKSNAFYRGNMFSIGNKIEYECVAGYKTNSTVLLTSTCLENGTWSPLAVLCLPEAVFVDDAYEWDNNIYKLVFKFMNWESARDECAKEKLHLVDVKTHEEQDFIENIITEEHRDNCFWSGGARREDGESFVWLDGVAISEDRYYWEHDQPNSLKGHQDCIVLIRGAYMWNDADCKQECYAICELL